MGTWAGQEEAFQTEGMVEVVLVWKEETQTRLEWNHTACKSVLRCLWSSVFIFCTSKIVDVLTNEWNLITLCDRVGVVCTKLVGVTGREVTCYIKAAFFSSYTHSLT